MYSERKETHQTPTHVFQQIIDFIITRTLRWQQSLHRQGKQTKAQVSKKHIKIKVSGWQNQDVETRLFDYKALSPWPPTSNLFFQAGVHSARGFQPQILQLVLFYNSSAQRFQFYFNEQQISKSGREIASLDNTIYRIKPSVQSVLGQS